MKLEDERLLPTILGSACAGIIARVFTHPLDTAKARVQADVGVSYRGPIDAITRTFSAEGWRGLYRGFGTVVIGGTPGTVLYLSSYEVIKRRLKFNNENENEAHFMVHFTSGMLAEAIACIVYVPVDIIKERLQVQQPNDPTYRNGYQALLSIARNEGLLGIYRGYGATLGSFGPFSALYFVFYERLKLWSHDQLHRSNKEVVGTSSLPLSWLVFCSCSAGGVASFLTSPLDMAKLRLQVQRGAKIHAPEEKYRGVWHCLTRAYQTAGVSGLFRGAGARVLHFAPATTVTMTSFETCKSFFMDNLTGR